MSERNVSFFYDNCWRGFSEWEQNEATQLLFKRMILNKVQFSLIENKECLDMGCGSGRYSKALIDLGAKKVIGIDAKKPKFKNKQFTFKQGDVLKLPFASNSFDFVFCNGVLHHTINWKKGVKEAVRVLKPEGWLWLYTIGNSRHWKIAERIRKNVLKHRGMDKDLREFLIDSKWPPNKVFYLLDSFCTPRRILLSKKEVEKELKLNKLKKIRYLEKYVEDISPKTHWRFIAQKPLKNKDNL